MTDTRAALDVWLKALRVDTAWPVADMLDKLADAAEHLMRGHDCDTHGWEEINGVIPRAREAAKAIREAFALATPAEKREWHGCSNPNGHAFDEGVCEDCGLDLRTPSELTGGLKADSLDAGARPVGECATCGGDGLALAGSSVWPCTTCGGSGKVTR